MADAVTGADLGGLEAGIEGLTGEGSAETSPATGAGSDGTTNTAPVATDDAGGMAASGESLVIQAADLLANDGDADGDALVLTGVGEAAHGTVTLGTDGMLSYVSEAGYSGTDSFEYTVSDGNGGVSSATVTVTVGPAETPSFALTQSVESVPAMAMTSHGGHMAHPDDEAKQGEHSALLNLLDSSAATHMAMTSGDWSDPGTWMGGRIPDQDADVWIPAGVSVTYDVVSDAELHYVRVDGGLHFATQTDTKMVVDTLFTTPSSHLTIGTEAQPVEAGVLAQIIIAADGPIDLSVDPLQLSRGVITHGKTEIVGQDKADFLKAAVAPEAGDNALIFAEQPEGWQVGDKLVVAAASNQMDQGSQQIEIYEDEVVTIKSITANADGTWTVELDQALQYDHVPPQHQSDAVLQIPVANYTRNVFIGSQTDGDQYLGDGNSVPIEERGHVMFMHNDDVVVQNAEFFELGRTDKSILISKAVDILREKLAAGEIRDNFEAEVRDFLATEAAASDLNVAGRYALHFHRTGTDDLDNPALAEGNAIWGSPGWGMVHHDANVNMISNAVFGTVGGGMVAEAGNETGIWADNIVIQTTGLVDTFNAESSGDPFHPDYVSDTLDDTFRQGEAYAMKSRLLEVTDNIAVSANGAGFSFWPHGVDGSSHIDSGVGAFADTQGFDPFYGQTTVGAAKVPTRDFFGNEVIGSRHALNTSSNKTDHKHDMDVLIEDLLAWNVDQAIMSFYQLNYIIKDSTFIKGTGNIDRFELGGFIGENGAATHIHDPTDFKLVNNHWEGWDVVTREPMEIIVGNTVVGSTLIAETGPGGIFREGFTADNDTIDYLDNSTDWVQNLPNPIGTITGQVNVAQSDLVMTQWFDPFLVHVEKTDTIGGQTAKFGSDRDAGFRGASQKTWWEENAVNKGYYERDGKIFLTVDLALGDRVTGSIGVIDVAIELRFLETEPDRLPAGALSNGALPEHFDADGVGTFRLVDKRVLDAPGNQLTRPEEPPSDDPVDPGPNTAPVAGDDGPFTVEAGTSVDIAVAALLANDQDADGDALSLGSVSASGGTIERLDVGGIDTIRFTADASAGQASLTYTVSDGQGGSDTATVALDVTTPPPPPDDPTDPPVADPDGIALLDAPQAFDGSSAVIVDHDTAFETDSGAITLTFQAASTAGRQGLFSKDSSGYDDGGHLTLTIENGTLRLRAQTTADSFDIEGGSITAGSVNTVTASWQNGTLTLTLNGAEIGSIDNWTGIAPNHEPIVLGATQTRSGNGVADKLANFFAGEIKQASFEVDVAPEDPPGPNTAPVAGDDGPFTVEAGTSVDIAVAALLANDQDADGDALSLGSVSASGGTIERLDVGGIDTIRFTADASAGQASLTYTVSDGQGGSDTATVALDVTTPPPPPDDPTDPPVADPDGIALLDAPQAFDGSSAVIVDHDTAFETDSGAITLTFQAASTAGRQGLFSKDSSGYDDGGHLTLTIENGTLRLRAQTTADSFDIEGGSITAGSVNTVTASWQNGTLTLTLNGAEIGSIDNWTGIAPNHEPIVLGATQTRSGNGVADKLANFFAGEIKQASFEVDVAPEDPPGPNTAPVAGDDGPFTVEAGTSVDIAVAALLANDQDADGDALSLGSVSASGGTIERLDVGGIDTIRFTADASAGQASLTYTVSDGQGGSDTATVALDVTTPPPPPDDPTDPPVADPDGIALLDAPQAFDGSSAVIVDHDTAFETDSGAITLTFQAASTAGRQGLFSKDSSGYDDGGHLTLTIENGTLRLRAQTTADSFDIEGGSITAGSVNTVTASWQNGTLTLTLNGAEIGSIDNWTGIAPNHEPIVLGATQTRSGNGVADKLANFFAGEIKQASFEVDVAPEDPPGPNTAPVAGDDGPFTVEAGTSVDIAVAALLANDQDADGDALSLGSVSASGGTIERLDVGGIDTIRFTADASAGQASLTYTVSDGQGGSDTATVALDVTTPPPPPDDPTDPPVADPDGIALLDAPQAFDGSSAVIVDHDTAFETDSGAITLTFQAASTAGRQGLFSKDSSGYDDGGHLTLTIENGTLRLRAQTTADSFDIEGGSITAGSVNTVTASWQNGTLTLTLNGAEIGSIDNWTGIAPNHEPIVLGATQTRSGNGVADKLANFFAGEIKQASFETDVAPDSSGNTSTDPSGSTDDALDLGATTAEMFVPYAEWTLDNPEVSGNPFDINAKAVFTHTATGEVRETGIFYNGDGSYAFRFSGVFAGEWTFTTVSDDAYLDGRSGTVEVAADTAARGFVVAEGTKFAQQLGDGSLDAILPNYIMIDSNLEVYYNNPDAIEDVVNTFIHEHGFTGLHLPHLGGQLFDIDSTTLYSGSRIDGSQGYDPDPRAFAALEKLIQASHEAGAVVHIWPWGDSARGQTPDQLPGSENGEAHQRMMDYMADRLGPLPGWTLGYGFDNYEWSSPADSAEAQAYFRDQTDFDHLTSVRPEPTTGQDDLTVAGSYNDGQTIASFQDTSPSYERFVAGFETGDGSGNPDANPVFFEDRYRDFGWEEGTRRQFSQEDQIDLLWIGTMAGGVANIWGNLVEPVTGEGDTGRGTGQFGSYTYSTAAIDQISTWNTFFNDKDRFALDMVRANAFTGGVTQKQYALYSDAEDLLVIYAEDTDTIELNLEQLAGDPDWANGARIIAVNTEGTYQEIDLSTTALEDQILFLDTEADWAVAITDL